MAQAKKKTEKDGVVVAAEIGAGIIAAASAAAAGYYFYADKDAAKHRRRTAKWAGEMKDKVVKEAKKELKKAEKLDKQAVAMIVDRATKTYEGVRNVKREDLVAAAAELKRNWKMLEAEITPVAKKAPAKKTATKVTKKAAPKKAVKKA
jgi:predicted AlkP superfamily phosphohydrolase/phosphomutase